MTKLFKLSFAGLALVCALAVTPAFAEDTPPPARGPHPGMVHPECKGDIATYCKDVKPGHGAIGMCLKEHEAQLSAPCKESIEKIKAMHPRMGACHEDMQKFCKDVKPGPATGECMRAHEAELSAPCKEEHAKMQMRHKEMMEKGMKGKGMMNKGMMEKAPMDPAQPVPPAEDPETPKAE